MQCSSMLKYNIMTQSPMLGPDTLGVSLLSQEKGNGFNFLNVVITRYSEFKTMKKVQKPSDSEC
jgi:hypothetical protein